MAALFTIPPALLSKGTYILPDAAGVTIPPAIAHGHFIVNMDTATKLSIGLTFSWQFFISTDAGLTWNFRNGATWRSYGPSGYIEKGVVNPDPALHVPLTDHIGDLVRVVLTLDQDLTAGVTVTTD